MHIHNPPSFFMANNTGAPHGELLGRINPASSGSLICLFNSSFSLGESRYAGVWDGLALGSSSMLCVWPEMGSHGFPIEWEWEQTHSFAVRIPVPVPVLFLFPFPFLAIFFHSIHCKSVLVPVLEWIQRTGTDFWLFPHPFQIRSHSKWAHVCSQLGTLSSDFCTMADVLDFDLATDLDFHLAISVVVRLKVLFVDFSPASVNSLFFLLLECWSSHPCRYMYHPTKLSLSMFTGVITILFAAIVNPAH